MKRIIQTAVDEINKVIVCIYCFSIISIFLFGFSSSNSYDNNCLKLEGIDSITFKDYHLIRFVNTKGKITRVISEKKDNSFINNSNYVKLDSLKMYCINIVKQESLFKARLSDRTSRYGDDITIIIDGDKDTIKYYDRGKIMVPVNKSIDIKGLFVLKEKTEIINHR
jgi:hypothetical protein